MEVDSGEEPEVSVSRVYADANEKLGRTWFDYGAFPLFFLFSVFASRVVF